MIGTEYLSEVDNPDMLATDELDIVTAPTSPRNPFFEKYQNF